MWKWFDVGKLFIILVDFFFFSLFEYDLLFIEIVIKDF